MIIINGRKAQYPGWELDRFFMPRVVTEPATLKVFLAPDNSFAAIKTLLEGATSSIRFEGYTFENARLGELIAARARAGVAVEILLEGGPPGGVSDQQLWVVQQIAQAGGRVYYLRSDSAADIHDRYTYQHGKFWVLDGVTALIGSENINAEAFPDDEKADGTFGRRGAYLVTDAPSVVAELDRDHGRRYRAGHASGCLGMGPGRPDPGRTAGWLRAFVRFGRRLPIRCTNRRRSSSRASSPSN